MKRERDREEGGEVYLVAYKSVQLRHELEHTLHKPEGFSNPGKLKQGLMPASKPHIPAGDSRAGISQSHSHSHEPKGADALRGFSICS